MKEITGHTVLTGLLGSPVSHSISPMMHNEAFRQLNLDYVYLAFDVDVEGMETLIDMLDELRQDYDLSILMTTHDFGMLPRYADHVVLIDHAVITQGSAEDVLNSDGFRKVFQRKEASK